ncbi:hypothetical protein [Streptomyces ortus]|uniref:Uncharacterized protein n=1 Tax=Streptomyces ortus TaxID=2867268 RepID=A0ABT3UYX2_9ACTN|nr:hypothetical protein [Streptomyces ortus]MCX4232780.1 hypothetical protein [Streptomyces ortus]
MPRSTRPHALPNTLAGPLDRPMPHPPTGPPPRPAHNTPSDVDGYGWHEVGI